MQFEGAAKYTKIVTGHADWTGAIVNVLIYVVIGWVLINLHMNQKMQIPYQWAKKLKLVEVEEINPELAQ